MKEKYKGRLNITDKASEALSVMFVELKREYPHVDINPSKLCSWIVEEYAKSQFVLNKDRIVQANSSLKRYLAAQLKAAKTEEEVRAILRSASEQIADVEPKKRKHKVRQRANTTAEDNVTIADLTVS